MDGAHKRLQKPDLTRSEFFTSISRRKNPQNRAETMARRHQKHAKQKSKPKKQKFRPDKKSNFPSISGRRAIRAETKARRHQNIHSKNRDLGTEVRSRKFSGMVTGNRPDKKTNFLSSISRRKVPQKPRRNYGKKAP